MSPVGYRKAALLAAYTALLSIAMLWNAEWRSEGYTTLAVSAIHTSKTPQGKSTRLTIEVSNREGRLLNYTLVVSGLTPGRPLVFYKASLSIPDGDRAKLEVRLPEDAPSKISVTLYTSGSPSPYRSCLIYLAGASDA